MPGSQLVVVIPADADVEAFGDWIPGPLPVRGPVPSGDGVITIEADQGLRESAFHQRVHDLLYPSGQKSRGRRAHHWVKPGESLELCSGVPVEAVECLFFDDPLQPNEESSRPLTGRAPGFLCLHTTITGPFTMTLVDALWHVVRDRVGRADLARSAGEWLRQMGVNGATLNGEATPYTVVFTLLEDPVAEPEHLPGTKYAEWLPRQQWTWLLSSLTPPNTYAPDISATDTGDDISLSSAWSARVLRDGTAFVAIRSARTAHQEWLFESLALYVRSIYLDALLLGIIQNRWLNEFADSLASAAIHHERDLLVVEGLDRAMSRFRARFWWRAAARGSHADSLIKAYQDQHQLCELLDNSAAEVTDLVRQARTDVERRTLQSARRTESIVSFLTILGIPILPVLTVWATLYPSWMGLSIAVAVYLFVVAVLALVLRRPGSWVTSGRR